MADSKFDYDPTDPKCRAGVTACLDWLWDHNSIGLGAHADARAALLPAPTTLLMAARRVISVASKSPACVFCFNQGPHAPGCALGDLERVVFNADRAAVEREKGDGRG